ncbi:MAG: RNA polymerase sigma factor [Mangrovibacterium sp.]
MRRDDDFQIIRKVQEGDISKFSILVDAYKDVSFSLACSLLKNESDAEDALQDAFVKAFQGLNKFKFDSSFATWFYRIVLNTCLSKRGKRKIYIDISLSDSEIMNLNENSDHPFSLLEQQEQKQMVNTILETMREEEALLLRLFYLAELSIVEIAETTSFSESKIKVSLHRARKVFRQKMEQAFGNELKDK